MKLSENKIKLIEAETDKLGKLMRTHCPHTLPHQHNFEVFLRKGAQPVVKAEVIDASDVKHIFQFSHDKDTIYYSTLIKREDLHGYGMGMRIGFNAENEKVTSFSNTKPNEAYSYNDDGELCYNKDDKPYVVVEDVDTPWYGKSMKEIIQLFK